MRGMRFDKRGIRQVDRHGETALTLEPGPSRVVLRLSREDVEFGSRECVYIFTEENQEDMFGLADALLELSGML